MKSDRTWQGVRLRQTEAAPDPDSPTRLVRLPASWDDAAAAALCELAPGTSRLSLPVLAQSWILPLSARAKEAGVAGLADRLHALLLHRQGAPGPGVWRGTAGETPCFVLNLPAFHDATAGFDVSAFAEAVTTAAQALHLLAPHAPRYAVAMADLAGLLAALGLDYAGKPARDVAACLAGVLRGRVGRGACRAAARPARRHPGLAGAPGTCAVAGLARPRLPRPGPLRCAAAMRGRAPPSCRPAPADALLGRRDGGDRALLRRRGCGRAAARHPRLAGGAGHFGRDAALAAALAGEPVVPVASPADHAAMHDAVAPFCTRCRPGPPPCPSPPTTRTGPSCRRAAAATRRRRRSAATACSCAPANTRTGGWARSGWRLPREGAAVRGLADAFAAAVSVGLQHGTPLDAYRGRGGPRPLRPGRRRRG